MLSGNTENSPIVFGIEGMIAVAIAAGADGGLRNHKMPRLDGRSIQVKKFTAWFLILSATGQDCTAATPNRLRAWTGTATKAGPSQTATGVRHSTTPRIVYFFCYNDSVAEDHIPIFTTMDRNELGQIALGRSPRPCRIRPNDRQERKSRYRHGTHPPADRHITGSRCRQWTMFVPSYILGITPSWETAKGLLCHATAMNR